VAKRGRPVTAVVLTDESCWAVLGAANDLGDAYQNVTANYLVGRANTAMTLLVGRSISIEGS
jgi:hypothetical protein